MLYANAHTLLAETFLKTLWERVGLGRNAVRAKTAAKKPRETQSACLTEPMLRGSVAFFGLFLVSQRNSTRLTQRAEPMAQRTSTATMPTTSTRTKVAEESATLALMSLASAATHAQQCKLHEVQVLLALSTENRTAMPAPQRVVTNSPVPVRNFWSAATTSSRAPAGPARALASPPPLPASSGPCTKRRAESTPSGSSSTGKKACQWKSAVLLNEKYATAAPLSPTAAPAPAPAPAAVAPSKKAMRCKWHTTQQIVPGKSVRAPASPRSVLSAPASPARSDCEVA